MAALDNVLAHLLRSVHGPAEAHRKRGKARVPHLVESHAELQAERLWELAPANWQEPEVS